MKNDRFWMKLAIIEELFYKKRRRRDPYESYDHKELPMSRSTHF